jgi:tetratricopeptide (TPR) repeat protein
MAKKGFGKSTTISVRDEVKFMRAVMKRIGTSHPNPTQVHQFFQSNLDKLDESFLEALPLVFEKLIANKPPRMQQNIASAFMNFGVSIKQFPLGDWRLNLEISIAAYHLALKIFTRKTFPDAWAMTQNNLGNAYRVRIRGEQANNIELAITAYNEALQVYTRKTFPEKWAMTQNNLGNAYNSRILGEEAGNIELSITAYNEALQVYTRKIFPDDWAMTQSNLGNAYNSRIRGERADNVELAITAYNEVLQVYTREGFPERWAGIQNNLGTAYSDRIRGERANNIELAITAYKLALEIYNPEAFPEKWATTQHNLANAYRERIQGERISNLEQAVNIYEQASLVFTKEACPHKWAGNQGGLAEALTKRALLTNSFTDLDTVIDLLQAALDVSVFGSSNFIDSQYRLGNAFSHRYEHSKNSSDLQQALQAYKTALDLINPEHYDRKEIWQALPTTQSILGSRLVQDGQWQEGLQLLLNSVTQLSTGDDPLAHANALFQTGRAHEVLSDWDNARLYYRDALRLYKHLQDPPGIAKSQAGLGGVLVSQGHLEKGMSELAAAREIYHQLQQPSQAAEVDSLYQSAQRAIERQAAEVFV